MMAPRRWTRSGSCARAASGQAAVTPPNSMMKSRRLMGVTPKPGSRAKYNRSAPCIAAKVGRSCPVRVIHDRCGRSHASMSVRFCPKADKRAEVVGHPLSAKRRHTRRSKNTRYSIMSSAIASSVGDTVRPSALAVSRLMTNSSLVGCSTDRSSLAVATKRRPPDVILMRLGKDAPLGPDIERSVTMIVIPILSRLHHCYARI
jgi:hypothetical protein